MHTTVRSNNDRGMWPTLLLLRGDLLQPTRHFNSVTPLPAMLTVMTLSIAAIVCARIPNVSCNSYSCKAEHHTTDRTGWRDWGCNHKVTPPSCQTLPPHTERNPRTLIRNPRSRNFQGLKAQNAGSRTSPLTPRRGSSSSAASPRPAGPARNTQTLKLRNPQKPI